MGCQETNVVRAPKAKQCLAGRQWLSWIGIGTAGISVAAILFLFDPARHGFYPRCGLHTLTGLSCPGCGVLRAAHHLLHGDLRSAWILNPLFVALLPFCGWYALCEAVRVLTGRVLVWPFGSARWAWVLLVVIVLFGVLRNVPGLRISPLSSTASSTSYVQNHRR